MTHRPIHRPQGYVMIAALILIAVTALVVMAASRGFSAQATHARLHARHAQLEQILLAGRDIIRSGHPAPDLTPALPPQLRDAGYTLTFSPASKTLTAAIGPQTTTLVLP